MGPSKLVASHLAFLFLRRYRLKAEYEAQQNWPTKWGYLTTSMEEVSEKFIRSLAPPLCPGHNQSSHGENGYPLIISKNELRGVGMTLWVRAMQQDT